MGVSTCIQDNSVYIKTGLLNLVYQLSLDVRLEIVYLYISILLTKFDKVIFKSNTAVNGIPFAYLRYKGKAWRFAGIKLLSIFLNIILNIFFLITCPWLHAHYPEAISWFYRPDYGVGYVFVANVFTTLITLLLLIPDILPGIRAKVDGTVLKQILRYSFPILILGIAGIFNQTADKILFPFLFDDKEYANEQLGIYGACFKIAVVMVMFTQAFRYAYEPFIFAKNKSDDNKKAYSEAMKYFIIFALFIFLGCTRKIDE